ncbi:aminoacyl-tRNA hydrolase [Candidatus Uhrbacteria bacterium]|nr:aminoacyl-tRNA hydrolase [Candidatus Uhrbacteria bacterium]
MKLLVGLGNPGEKYEHTRHNAGVIALEHIMAAWKNDSRFEDMGREKNRAYTMREFRFSFDGVSTEKLVVLFPQTFMNVSGLALKKYLDRVRDDFLPSNDLWVFHDDMDILFGLLKIDRNASSAGHNGVQNIIDQIGTKDFVRFRIGIRPRFPTKKPTDQFVLQKFSKKESTELGIICENVLNACEIGLISSIAKAQSVCNKKNCS